MEGMLQYRNEGRDMGYEGKGVAPGWQNMTQQLEEAKAATELSSDPTLQSLIEKTAVAFTPLATAYTGLRSALGALAALSGSVEEGVIGDTLGTRDREAMRDMGEDQGMSYSETAERSRRDARSEYEGWGPSAYGLTSGVKEGRFGASIDTPGLDEGLDSPRARGSSRADFNKAEIDSIAPTISPRARQSISSSIDLGDRGTTGGSASVSSGAQRGLGLGDQAGYGGTRQETAASEMDRASGGSSSGNGAGGGSAGGGSSSGDGSGAGGATGGDKDGGRY